MSETFHFCRGAVALFALVVFLGSSEEVLPLSLLPYHPAFWAMMLFHLAMGFGWSKGESK
jgi:hypothetical protein